MLLLIRRAHGHRAKTSPYRIYDPKDTLDGYARIEAKDGFLNSGIPKSLTFGIRRPEDNSHDAAPLVGQFWNRSDDKNWNPSAPQVWNWRVRNRRFTSVGEGQAKTLREAARDMRNFLHDGSLDEALRLAEAAKKRKSLGKMAW